MDWGELEKEILANGITIDMVDMNCIVACTVCVDDHYYIGINKNKNLTPCEVRYVIEHEYSHIRTNAFYNSHSSLSQIIESENRANDDMVARLHLDKKILPFLLRHASNDEICESLSITHNVLCKTINYIRRKRIL